MSLWCLKLGKHDSISFRVIDRGWLGCVCRFQPYLVMMEGGTLVQVSEGYDLLPMVKERDTASSWLLAKRSISPLLDYVNGSRVDKADLSSSA